MHVDHRKYAQKVQIEGHLMWYSIYFRIIAEFLVFIPRKNHRQTKEPGMNVHQIG